MTGSNRNTGKENILTQLSQATKMTRTVKLERRDQKSVTRSR
jgi:hypothetical protein